MPVIPEPDRLPPSEADRLLKLAKALAARRCEALALYEPVGPVAEAFHACRAPEAILLGSNRSSKTFTGLVELARAVTGQDPYGKYPKKNGRAFVVGKDNKHTGEVLWRKLSRAGQFRMIKDPQTRAWRNFRPWQIWDQENVSAAKMAPPILPPRMVEEIAWENKKQGVPLLVKMTTGWEINFLSSKSEPPQGTDIDLAVLDEEIINENFYPELSARLIDRGGKFRWMATPQAGTDQLYDLYLRSIEQEERPPEERTIIAFALHIKDNPYLAERDKQLIYEKYTPGTNEYAVRIDGKFALLSHLVYPTWDIDGPHGVDPFEIPADWTRYLVVDPGRQTCAVLWAAIPPPDIAMEVMYLYDELYLHDCDAMKFGLALRDKGRGQEYEAFIIDHRAGKTHEIASGQTIESRYAEQFKLHGLESRQTGHGFNWGPDDVNAGIDMVRSYLYINPRTNLPKLRAFKNLHHLNDEFKKYRHKKNQATGLVSDEVVKKFDHLMDALRMLCMSQPSHVKKRASRQRLQGAAKALANKRARQRRQAGIPEGERPHVSLGPLGEGG